MLNKNQSKTVNFWRYMVVFPAVIAFIFLFQQKIVAQVKDTETRAEVVGLSWDKNATEEEFKSDAKLVQEQGVTLEFKNVVRNAKNEITSIDIYFKDKMDEKRNMKNFSNPNGIETIYFKRTYDSKTGKYFFGFVSEKDTFEEYFPPSMDNVSPPNPENPKETKQKSEKQKDINASIEYYKLKNKNNEMLKDMKKNMLIIVNGKEYQYNDFNNFKFETDGTITRYEPKDAIEKFGEKGKYGALVFTGNTTIQNDIIAVEKSAINENPNGDKVLLLKKQNDVGVKVPGQSNIDADNNPLVVVNGKIIQENSREYLEKLNPETIKEINVLKGEKATEKYGEKAINGAIEIKLK